MNRISHSTAQWFRAALLLAALGMMGNPLSAQSQRKSPVKPPPQSSSQPREDPLAALLQQATEAIDKNDFSAALDPLQRFIAERRGEPDAHSQLGYADGGLKRREEAKGEFSRTIGLGPKMAAA